MVYAGKSGAGHVHVGDIYIYLCFIHIHTYIRVECMCVMAWGIVMGPFGAYPSQHLLGSAATCMVQVDEYLTSSLECT